MGILDDLTRMIPETEAVEEKSDVKFNLEYNESDGTYSVLNDGNKCCLVEFVNTSVDRTVEIDDAQLEPEYHVVYMSKINEAAEAKEFELKLDDMGFDNISIEECDECGCEDDKKKLTETSNMDVVQAFINDSFAHDEEEAREMGIDQFSTVWGSTNLKISKQDNGWALINYDTPLMFRSDSGDLYFNTNQYSATTTRIQDDIKDTIGDTEVKEVDEEGIKDVIQ